MSTPERRSPRRFFRFSIRGLMLLVLAVGVPLGWVVNRAHVQRDAVAAIRRAGGNVRYDREMNKGKPGSAPAWLAAWVGGDYFDTAVWIWFSSPPVDADLVAVGRLPGLGHLNLSGASSITDEGLKHLAGLHHLQRLMLDGTAITGRGLVHLKGMTGLIRLTLDGTRVDGAGMEHLRMLTNLRELGLNDTRVDDAGLVYLKGMSHLFELNLKGTRVDDAGLENLRGWGNLQLLLLGDTTVTDVGLAYLAEAPSLQRVDLHHPKIVDEARPDDAPGITDAGIAHVAKLPNLRYLSFATAGATDAGIARLRKARWVPGK